jgi:precorrin-3B methylase
MADVRVVGLGLRPGHRTVETEATLRECNEVFYLEGWELPELEALAPRVTRLFPYAEGEGRRSVYHEIAARVVDAALAHPPVGFAMQGHPSVGCYTTALLRDLCRVLGLEIEVLPGISALAALLADLGVDPLVRGLQLYEATDLLLRRRPLLVDVPALIWQAGTVESLLYTARPNRPERFIRLRNHLRQFYPPTHPVAILYSDSGRMQSARDDVALDELPQHAERLHAGVTLYVPPAAERAIQDPGLLEVLADPEHLVRVTRDP